MWNGGDQDSCAFGSGLRERSEGQGHPRTGKARNSNVIWNDHGSESSLRVPAIPDCPLLVMIVAAVGGPRRRPAPPRRHENIDVPVSRGRKRQGLREALLIIGTGELSIKSLEGIKYKAFKVE